MVSAFRRNIRSFLRVNKPSSILKEFTSYRLWLDLGLEVIVTGFFIFAFFALFVRWDNRPEVTIVQVGLTVGIVVSMLLEMSWHWGEVHINQSITLMHAVLGLNSIPTALLRMTAQSIGSIGGAATAYFLAPPELRDTMAPLAVNARMSPLQGFLMEMVLTTILCVTAISGTDPARSTALTPPSLMAGFTVASLILYGGYFSGASMNPSIVLGPAVMTNKWGNHWVYWAGPFAGAVIASLLYTVFATTWELAEDQKTRREGKQRSTEDQGKFIETNGENQVPKGERNSAL